MKVISAEAKWTLSLKQLQGQTHFSTDSPEGHPVICGLRVLCGCRIMGEGADCFKKTATVILSPVFGPLGTPLPH